MLWVYGFICIIHGLDFRIDHHDLGFYEVSNFHRMSDKYLLLSRTEGAMALVDGQGNLYRKYLKPGLGPRELHLPFVLGMNGDRVLIVSNGKRVLDFNCELLPDTRSLPNLPASLLGKVYLYGIMKKHHTYLLAKSGLSPSPFLVVEVELSGGIWRQTASYFKQRDPGATSMEAMSRNYKLNIHHRMFFRTTFVADENYEVSVHEEPVTPSEDGEMVQFLRQPLDEFPKWYPWYRASMLDAVRTRFGYAVFFHVKPVEGNEPRVMADLFQEDGSFIKRLVLEASPISCTNCEEIWILDQSHGQEILKPWRPLQD